MIKLLQVTKRRCSWSPCMTVGKRARAGLHGFHGSNAGLHWRGEPLGSAGLRSPLWEGSILKGHTQDQDKQAWRAFQEKMIYVQFFKDEDLQVYAGRCIVVARGPHSPPGRGAGIRIQGRDSLSLIRSLHRGKTREMAGLSPEQRNSK